MLPCSLTDTFGRIVGLLKAFLLLFSLCRYNVEPPGLIKLEKEIEQEERAPQPPPSPVSPVQPLPPSPSASPAPSPPPAKVTPSKKSTGKLLDDAVRLRRRATPACAFRFSIGVGTSLKHFLLHRCATSQMTPPAGVRTSSAWSDSRRDVIVSGRRCFSSG